MVSPLTVRELEGASEDVRRVLRDLSPNQIEAVPLSDEVLMLANGYVQAGVLGAASEDDATHVAAATVAG